MAKATMTTTSLSFSYGFEDDTGSVHFEQFVNEEIRSVATAEVYFESVRTACREFLWARAEDISEDPRNVLGSRGAGRLRRTRGLCIQLSNALSGLNEAEVGYLVEALVRRFANAPDDQSDVSAPPIGEFDLTGLQRAAAELAYTDMSFLAPKAPSPRNRAELNFARHVVREWIEIVGPALRRTKSYGQPFQRSLSDMLSVIIQRLTITLRQRSDAPHAAGQPFLWSKQLNLADFRADLNRVAARGVREILGTWS